MNVHSINKLHGSIFKIIISITVGTYHNQNKDNAFRKKNVLRCA